MNYRVAAACRLQRRRLSERARRRAERVALPFVFFALAHQVAHQRVVRRFHRHRHVNYRVAALIRLEVSILTACTIKLHTIPSNRQVRSTYRTISIRLIRHHHHLLTSLFTTPQITVCDRHTIRLRRTWRNLNTWGRIIRRYPLIMQLIRLNLEGVNLTNIISCCFYLYSKMTAICICTSYTPCPIISLVSLCSIRITPLRTRPIIPIRKRKAIISILQQRQHTEKLSQLPRSRQIPTIVKINRACSIGITTPHVCD